MKVQHDFIPLSKPHITEDEVNAVSDVIRSGWWTTGPKVTEFEESVCGYLGKDLSAVALNSCTAGLFLTLKALGIGPGDEVIVPTWTFAATAQVVEWLEAKPVICDVRPDDLNIDPEKVEALCTAKTRAIIPVHMAGYPCDLNSLYSIGAQKDISVIEDAAHAIGSKYNGEKIGSTGLAAVFSFYATKNVACGEGGMVITPDQSLAEKIRRLSYFGIDKNAFRKYEDKDSWYYEIVELGYKFNMDSLHAAMGLVQLKKLESTIRRRLEIANIYRKNLRRVRIFENNRQHLHSFHLFVVTLPDDISRDWAIKKLREYNIGSGVHYIPLHLHPHYKDRFPINQFPVATSVYKNILSLPMYPSLSDEEVLYICDRMNSLVGE